MVARRPPPEFPDPAREQREVKELEQLIRARWHEWVRLALVVAMPAKVPLRFLGK